MWDKLQQSSLEYNIYESLIFQKKKESRTCNPKSSSSPNLFQKSPFGYIVLLGTKNIFFSQRNPYSTILSCFFWMKGTKSVRNLLLCNHLRHVWLLLGLMVSTICNHSSKSSTKAIDKPWSDMLLLP